MRTLRLKVRRETYGWLNAAAVEVNEVFNYCNEISLNTATRSDTKRKWLTGFDLCSLTAGASPYYDKIGADTIQSICTHYAQKRQAKRIHRKAARCRADALHKFSTCIVERYQNIVVGDVSSPKLVKTRMLALVVPSAEVVMSWLS
jgi:hypothetical protein